MAGRGNGQVGMNALRMLTVEQIPIDQLRPDPANPRRIGDEELESLTRSLRQFGFVQPVLARKEDGTVIDIAYGGPAHKAGIAPAVAIVAVDNRQFTPTILREAVQATASTTTTSSFTPWRPSSIPRGSCAFTAPGSSTSSRCGKPSPGPRAAGFS